MTPAVVCVGTATLDTIVSGPRHPAADDRVVASAHAVAGGGPAATAAVALARLGIEVSLVGQVGDDKAGAAIREGLEQEGVDVSALAAVPGGRSAQSAVLVGEESGTRAISAFLGSLPPLELGPRARELCRSAAWVHVDHLGYAAAAQLPRQVRLSVDGGNPIDGLDLRGVALYAPTEAALRPRLRGGSGGARGRCRARRRHAWRGRERRLLRDGEVIEAAGVEVDVVSTLGAGDVFHGALLAHLVRDVPLPDALAAANACAALSCRALDGRSAIPTANELARSVA